MPYNSSEVTPWDEDFKPSPATAIACAAQPSRTQHQPLNVPYTSNATSSTLAVTVDDPDAITPYVPSNALHLSSHNSSLSSKPSTSSASSRTNKEPRASTKSRSNSISANTSHKPNISEGSTSSSDKSKAADILENSKKKERAKGLLDFLTVKEPSNKALEDFSEQQRRELKEKGLERPFGVSSQCLPPEVPKVNSKWDGLPDDKRNMIKTMEKQKKKERQQYRRQSSDGTRDQEDEEAGYVVYYSPPSCIPRSAHTTRPSISSTSAATLTLSETEAYKTCDPKSRGPRARPATGVRFIAEDEDGSYTAYNSGPSSPTVNTGVNRLPSIDSLQGTTSYVRTTDGACLVSDSDMATSPDEWMPKTPSIPPQRPVHGRRKSIPLTLPISSPLEKGMRNVAALAPFATDTSVVHRTGFNSRPTTSLTQASVVSTGSAFMAGEAQEVEVVSEHLDEGALSSPDYFSARSQRPADGTTNVATTPSSPRTAKGSMSWARSRGNSASQSSSIWSPNGVKVQDGMNEQSIERNRGEDPSLTPPTDEQSSSSRRRPRRMLFGKK